MLNLVTEQKVGIVLGLEMSRLARNSKDWHDLFEVCAIYQVLIVNVHDNSERISIVIHWAGGFESCHDIRRSVMTFAQLEGYEDLVQRALTLTLEGISSPAVAEILEREGYRSPRLDKRISADMVKYLLLNHADSAKQMNDPDQGHP